MGCFLAQQLYIAKKRGLVLGFGESAFLPKYLMNIHFPFCLTGAKPS